MSVTFPAPSLLGSSKAKPADTLAATLYTAPAAQAVVVVAMNIAATAAASATVWLGDGTDWLLLDAKAIAANTTETYTFGNPVLLSAHTIKIKSSSASNLTFVLTTAQINKLI